MSKHEFKQAKKLRKSRKYLFLDNFVPINWGINFKAANVIIKSVFNKLILL